MSDMVRVTDNFAEGAAILDQVARRAGNTVGLMRECAAVMHGEVEQNFDREGRPNKWKPLAAATIRACLRSMVKTMVCARSAVRVNKSCIRSLC